MERDCVIIISVLKSGDYFLNMEPSHFLLLFASFRPIAFCQMSHCSRNFHEQVSPKLAYFNSICEKPHTI